MPLGFAPFAGTRGFAPFETPKTAPPPMSMPCFGCEFGKGDPFLTLFGPRNSLKLIRKLSNLTFVTLGI